MLQHLIGICKVLIPRYILAIAFIHFHVYVKLKSGNPTGQFATRYCQYWMFRASYTMHISAEEKSIKQLLTTSKISTPAPFVFRLSKKIRPFILPNFKNNQFFSPVSIEKRSRDPPSCLLQLSGTKQYMYATLLPSSSSS